MFPPGAYLCGGGSEDSGNAPKFPFASASEGGREPLRCEFEGAGKCSEWFAPGTSRAIFRLRIKAEVSEPLPAARETVDRVAWWVRCPGKESAGGSL